MWLTAFCCCGASAQVLAPHPHPELTETQPPKNSVPVRMVPAPMGQMLERADIPSGLSAAANVGRGDPGLDARKRLRAVSRPDGAKMLESIDATPVPATQGIDPSRLVERTAPGGQRMLGLTDEAAPPWNPGPARVVVDVPAEPREAASNLHPDPNVLYRVVKPATGP
jgi:hypothetical protein